MKDNDKKAHLTDGDAHPGGETDSRRRGAIKAAGIAGGVAATGVWVKPVVESVVLPAHGQTTGEDPDDGPQVSALRGPTSGSDDIVMHRGGDTGERSIAETLLEAAVPAAVAGANLPSVNVRDFFNLPELRNCVTLEFPVGNIPSGPINVTISGPPVYSAAYNFGGSYYYPVLSYQFQGSQGGNLGGPDGLDFDLNFGDFSVAGCITDNDFTGAVGYVYWNSGCTPSVAVTQYYMCSDEGASFTASIGGSCTPGSGNFASFDTAYFNP
jgi:hypothetical protein